MPLPADRAHDVPQHQQHDLPQEHQQDSVSRRLTALPDGHPSSLKDEDGNPRKPTIDLRDLELPIDDRGSRATDRTDSTERKEQAVSDTWREQLPALQSLWDHHLERWPEKPDQGAVDRSADEPGSWRGDSGLFLTAADNMTADRILDRAHQVEEKLTDSMTTIEAEIPDASLVGLDHRLKYDDRFKEKLAQDLQAMPGRTSADVANDIPDVIRYTYQTELGSYTGDYYEMCRKIESHGNELVLSRNFWDDSQYKGINTRWETPQGQLFEVQLHTADSFSAKQLTHPAYERIRTSAAAVEREELWSYQELVSSRIPVPPGALEIEDFDRRLAGDD
jgi:hypothetical protein